MKQSQGTPEQFEMIKKLMESELERAFQKLEENPSGYVLEDYARALDRLTAWVSYHDRLEVSKDMQEIETVIRRAWYADSEVTHKLFTSVLSNKERRRERWCRYAASSLSYMNATPEAAAGDADMMLDEEEKRFGKTTEDPERSRE